LAEESSHIFRSIHFHKTSRTSAVVWSLEYGGGGGNNNNNYIYIYTHTLT